jgi:NADH-quinone oxidoreductase subunit G
LSEVALAVAKAKSATAPAGIANVPVSPVAQKIADSLISGSTKAVLLGSAAIAHPHASDLHVLAQFIAEQTGSTLGFLPVGGNAVGAALVNANGAGIESILSGDRKAVLLMNIEPDADLPDPTQARAALAKANTVIALSAYKSADLLEVADVILPISTFTETVGTFVNAEGSAQTIQPSVKPLGDSRPAWKVLRVLGDLLNLDGFLFNLPEEVLGEALNESYCTRLNNKATSNSITSGNLAPMSGLERIADVNIYAGDQIVRRSSALQLTRDAKRGNQAGLNQKLFTELGLKEGEPIRVSQGSHTVDMPATLEVNLAPGAVRISAGTMASAKLGSMYGPITVSKA